MEQDGRGGGPDTFPVNETYPADNCNFCGAYHAMEVSVNDLSLARAEHFAMISSSPGSLISENLAQPFFPLWLSMSTA